MTSGAIGYTDAPAPVIGQSSDEALNEIARRRVEQLAERVAQLERALAAAVEPKEES